MASVIASILALANAVPVIDKWLGLLLSAYATQKKLILAKETVKAVNEAIKEQDQRHLESSNYSGEYSGHGTIRDSIPNVVLHNKKKT